MKEKEMTLKQKQGREALSKEGNHQLAQQGSQLLEHVMPVVVVDVTTIVTEICVTIKATFIIGGYFVAMELK